MKAPYKKSPRPHPRTLATVSAAALMLGVSHAATVGLHFQENYCGAPAYSGFPVTLPAFGIAPAGWQNLTAMQTGYGGCNPLPYYTLSQTITSTSTDPGLNPLPAGSLTVTWSANGANFSGFAGYGGKAPGYAYDGPPPAVIPTGEWQIYSTFLRDGVNFGAADSNGSAAPGYDNNQPGYRVEVSGLQSVFGGHPYVVQLIAASDSMQTLTNAFLIDVATGLTNSSVAYTNTPFPPNNEGAVPWFRGHGGGLSTASGALTTDHLLIVGNRAQHGTDATLNGYDNASTISGFIVTDKPVVSMSPQPVSAGPGDTIILRALAVGVPPLACQWRVGGVPIAGATNLSYTIPSATTSGNYDLLVTNLYGSATSKVAAVTVDTLTIAPQANFTVDTNPSVPANPAVLVGAKQLASAKDGNNVTRTGVAQFNANDPDQIVVSGATTNFDSGTGTISFWMRSDGANLSGTQEATLVDRRTAAGGAYIHLTATGQIHVQSQGSVIDLSSFASVNDNKWHHITLTYDVTMGVQLYVDGVADYSYDNLPSAVWNWPAGQQIELGLSHDPQWQAFSGQLDDVRLYTRILDSTEIGTLYTSNAVVDATTLVLRLDFNTAPVAGVSINWQSGTDVLQSATSLNGPFTNLPQATSPYYVLPGGAQQFFRFTHTTATLQSNPYDM